MSNEKHVEKKVVLQEQLTIKHLTTAHLAQAVAAAAEVPAQQQPLTPSSQTKPAVAAAPTKSADNK